MKLWDLKYTQLLNIIKTYEEKLKWLLIKRNNSLNFDI